MRTNGQDFTRKQAVAARSAPRYVKREPCARATAFGAQCIIRHDWSAYEICRGTGTVHRRGGFGQSREDNGAQAQPPTDQIIVKWRDGSAATAAAVGARVQKLGSSSGMRLQRKHQIGIETEVLQLDRALDEGDMNALLERMAADPNIEYAVADERRWPHALPGDPLFADQWYFQSTQPAATRAEQAWDVTVGSNTDCRRRDSIPACASSIPICCGARRPASCSTASISFPTRRSPTMATAAMPTPPIPATG